MRRRTFIKLMGGVAATWPLAARAQQPPLPVVGFLSNASPDLYVKRLAAFREGLKEDGYVENLNVAIEYRWADGHNDRLPALAAELVQRQVAVIASGGGTPTVLAAKSATATIPVVFAVSDDPVKMGLVSSLNRPGGNLTGVSNLNVEVGPKRLELLREMVPNASVIALLVNPTNPSLAESFTKALQAAATTLGIKLPVLQASADPDFDNVFAAAAQLQADALVIMPDIFFATRTGQLASLALRYRLPAIYAYRPFVAAGGLVSYGADENEYYHLLGAYTGKILKGAKPADLPVVQSTKVELMLNLKTAKALGITVPLTLLGRADEVIE
jgi:putative tryptophan/tyrosine transport system substrate-binding protein